MELSGRPVDFSARQIANLDRLSGDVLIHCGDFCIGDNEENTRKFMLAAHGFKKKILVRGNHDPQSDAWYLARGWDFVCESFANTYFGKEVLFTHIPVKKFDRFDFNVHGHMHGNNHRVIEGMEYDPSFHIDLAPEIRNYAPVQLQDVLQSAHN